MTGVQTCALPIYLATLAARQAGGRIHLESTSAVSGPSWPNGCHVCEVEVDPATGTVQVVAYSSVNDIGRVVNPTIVRGQLDGGAVQGLGQALCEAMVYDEETGQPLTGSFTDYALPRAADTPSTSLWVIAPLSRSSFAFAIWSADPPATLCTYESISFCCCCMASTLRLMKALSTVCATTVSACMQPTRSSGRLQCVWDEASIMEHHVRRVGCRPTGQDGPLGSWPS